MTIPTSGGSPIIRPQQYQTLPTTVISHAEQHDRCLQDSELKTLGGFFESGTKRLQVVETLNQHADEIVSAGADRIFFGGLPMAFLERPPNRQNLPGYNVLLRDLGDRPKERLKVQSSTFNNPLQDVWRFLKVQLTEGRAPLPDGFRPINISRYGPVRMKRSMRDLGWFLRYVTYAIVAGDSSIIATNVRGLRGVIPEDVTEATVVAIQDMLWKALSYFQNDLEATAIVQEPFDVLLTEYIVEKPQNRLRQGVSSDHQGLELPESYGLSATNRPKFVMKPGLPATEQEAVIKAAYRQIFERDVTREYGLSLTDLESKFKSGQFSTKEFVRQMGKSRLYRKLCYEPFVISRVIELAVRHFLGRGVSSIEEFQTHFDTISQKGFPALVDSLVDSVEYSDYFGEETVPYLRGLGQEAQECRNWGAQIELFKHSAVTHKVPQFITLFSTYQPTFHNQHFYGAGNDPLEIQFGTIFPEQNWKHHDRPAAFNKDHQRILIGYRTENGNGNGNGHSETWGKAPGLDSQPVVKLHHTNGKHGGKNGKNSEQGASVDLLNNSPDLFIQKAYRQIFGRDIYPEQRNVTAEIKLKSGEITVREFVRQVAKSRSFRQLYWETLYVTKAIEVIHRRLLGRPTTGRQEMNRYYDLCARKGFYALIDELIDCTEYRQAFGDETVPFERYVTPRGFEMRFHRGEAARLHDRQGNPLIGERVFHGTWVKPTWQKARASIQGDRPEFRGTQKLLSTTKLDQRRLEPNKHSEDRDQSNTQEPSEVTSEATEFQPELNPVES
ncbi:phycobilisome rod-core linker polypeptide [Phormidesmis sp. 146-33]